MNTQTKFAAVLGFIAVALVYFGLNTMYDYGRYNEESNPNGDRTGHIVGGDAYNYQIIGIRGLGYVMAGVAAAVLSVGCLLVPSKEAQEVLEDEADVAPTSEEHVEAPAET